MVDCQVPRDAGGRGAERNDADESPPPSLLGGSRGRCGVHAHPRNYFVARVPQNFF